jgi:plastocyanin
MDRDQAARNMRLGALLFVVALIMFGFSFAFAVVFLKGNEVEGQEAVAPTTVAGQTPAPGGTPAPGAAPPAVPPAQPPPAEATPPAGAPPPGAAQVLEIKAVPTFRFDQEELQAKADGAVTVRFENEDAGVPHNWAVYTDDSASDAIAGASEGICTAPCSEDITFELPAPGEYFFRCDVHPTQMKGTFIVQ